MDNVTKILFRSKYRKIIDQRLFDVIEDNTPSNSLKELIFYHLGMGDTDIHPNYTLGHSKRFRAFLCLFSGEKNNKINQDVLLNLSISVELIHNATLIVDDIQDNDLKRCNKIALWKKFGISNAMNVAFYLSNLGQALFHKTATDNNLFDYSDLFLNVFGKVASGQQSDLDGCSIINSDFYEYTEMVAGKTSTLLFLSCLLGAFPYGVTKKNKKIVYEFCLYLGLLHQLNDDAEDENFQHLIKLNNHNEVLQKFLICRKKMKNIISNDMFFIISDGVVNRKITKQYFQYGEQQING
jgi:geranylgeranyl pyrophosphate synthase